MVTKGVQKNMTIPREKTFRIRATGPGGERLDFTMGRGELAAMVSQAIVASVHATQAIEGEEPTGTLFIDPRLIPDSALVTQQKPHFG
jgi:hypothetical protein